MKPRVFIASTVDDLPLTGILAELLDREAEAVAWTEDVLTLSDAVLSSLQRTIHSVDLAIFVVRPPLGDFRRWELSPNLIVEMGICIGILGAERTILVFEGAEPKGLPSDVRGLTFVVYPVPEHPDQLRQVMLPVGEGIRDWVKHMGARRTKRAEPPAPGEVVVTTERPQVQSEPTRRSSRRPKVFISYSHIDAKWLSRIRTMITPLVRTSQIVVWDDSQIKPGSNWRGEIRKAIESSQVALLLVSASFLASPFIAEHELPPILDSARQKGLVVIWALVSTCMYKKTAIAEYQAAHSISKPLESLPLPKRNEALLSIAEAIGSALEQAGA